VIGTEIDLLRRQLSDLADPDGELAPLTTYRLGGRAALMVRPRTVDDLLRIGAAWAATALPLLVVGRGSNLLVADEGFPGLVVVTADLLVRQPPGDTGGGRIDDGIDVVADRMSCVAGVLLPQAARRSAALGLSGFEWAVGVPGSIGGAVRMNAGGHGSDMAATLVDATIVDLRDQRVAAVPVERLGLRFRGSALADHQLVLAATLQLRFGDRVESEEMISSIVRWRREHQPGGQNAGSVFVNPVPGEVAAGELIDRCGLRGFRVGGASVSDKHANFIQAGPGATAADVRAVIAEVRRRVAEATGFLLRSEIRHAGFADDGNGDASADQNNGFDNDLAEGDGLHGGVVL
jgi:UDP-N-acetylmuramate dehydrogenase